MRRHGTVRALGFAKKARTEPHHAAGDGLFAGFVSRTRRMFAVKSAVLRENAAKSRRNRPQNTGEAMARCGLGDFCVLLMKFGLNF